MWIEPRLLPWAALLTLVLVALASGHGCRPSTDDDDSSAGADDDDDSTPPPVPLGDVIGVFNLTNVVRGATDSYVDFSGAFGTFASIETDTLSPAAYLGSFNYSADAPFWLPELGGFPTPAIGESVIVDLFDYFPWSPAEQEWWDGGPRIGLGNYLCSRLDLEDVSAYQVDDPLSPGVAGWLSGGSLDWHNQAGEHVVGSVLEGRVQLPLAVSLEAPSVSEVHRSPAARDLEVSWSPGLDSAAVSVGLIRESRLAYVASVADVGSHTIPADVLHGEFGPGAAELVLARTLENRLAHPQGDILVRTREERRVQVELLPDVVLDPAFGEPGQTVIASIHWYAGTFDATTTLELGQLNSSGGIDADGVTVLALVPDTNDPSRADLQVMVSPAAVPGPRDLKIVTGSASIEWPAGFAVLDLLPSDDCLSANAIEPLAPGSYTSSTAGLSNSISSGFSCLPWSLNGSDSVYRVELQEGQVLLATMLQAEPTDGAMALLSACGDALSAVACADGTFEGESEVLSYIAEATGVYYLVVDSYVPATGGSSSGPFSLEVEVSAPALRPGWILPGETRNFTLSSESPFSIAAQHPAALDFGSGVSIDQVTAGASPEQLEVQASASLAAALGPRDLSVDNGGSANPVQFLDALYVTGWPVYDSCAEASAAPAVQQGSSAGYGVQTSSRINSVPCLPWASIGPELFMPLDVVAGTSLDLGVVSEEDIQLYVLSDCNLPESCLEEAAVDETVGGDFESILDWVPTTTGRYYLVIDMYAAPADLAAWQFDLNVFVQ